MLRREGFFWFLEIEGEKVTEEIVDFSDVVTEFLTEEEFWTEGYVVGEDVWRRGDFLGVGYDWRKGLLLRVLFLIWRCGEGRGSLLKLIVVEMFLGVVLLFVLLFELHYYYYCYYY